MKRSSRENVEEGLAIHIPTYLFQSVGGYNLSTAMSLGTLSKSFKIGTPLNEETKRLYRSRHPPSRCRCLAGASTRDQTGDTHVNIGPCHNQSNASMESMIKIAYYFTTILIIL